MTSEHIANLRYALAFLLAVAFAPAALHACTPGAGVARCPGANTAWDNRTRPLTREDINARIGTPGAPIGDAVTADTFRTWGAVRRQPQLPVIVNPADQPLKEQKRDVP